jgi:integrase
MKGVIKRGNSYRITVSKGYDDKGKQIRLTTTYTPPKGASEAQIAYEIEQIKKELTEDKLTRERMTFQSLYDLWKKTVAKEDLERSTYTDTVSRLENVILPELGCYKLINITPMVIHDYLKGLRTMQRADGNVGYAESTITRMKSMISTVFEFGVQYGYIQANPCRSVRMKHKMNEGVVNKEGVFTPQQTKKFLEILDKPIPVLLDERKVIRNGKTVTLKACDMNKPFKVALKYKLFFYIAVFAGMRRGEIIALTWEDLNFDEGIINVNKSTARDGSKQYIKMPKSANGIRQVCVPLFVMDIAKKVMEEQQEYIEKVGSYWKGKKGSESFIFVQEDGLQMRVETPYTEFKRIIHAYNKTVTDPNDILPNIPLHGLRHTSASLAKMGGADTYALSKRLGHADISTTLNIYVDMFREADRQGSDAIVRALGINTKTNTNKEKLEPLD